MVLLHLQAVVLFIDTVCTYQCLRRVRAKAGGYQHNTRYVSVITNWACANKLSLILILVTFLVICVNWVIQQSGFRHSYLISGLVT